MASRMIARTPSPPPADEMQAPSAPRYGWQDNYQPYPKPSRSTRSSTQRNRTPSPPTSRQRPLASPRGAKKANNQSNAAMVSPVPSPRKRRQPPANTNHRSVSGSLTAESIANAAAALGPFDLPPTSNPVTSAPPPSSSSRSGAMLPTPSKTPSKPANEKTTAEIKSFARNLFASDDSGLKRKPKSYSGLGMDSFTAKQEDEPIEIFTDTKDSIPEIDTSEENPFYTGPAKQETETSPRRSRRKVVIPGEGSHSLEDATKREDGMVYVFRGKKFWRKFAADDEEMDQETRLAQPLTRSSVKPRLLFPPKQPEQSEIDLEEEEADTDVEDEVRERSSLPVPQTPTKARKESAKTPEAPKYAPVSPPETRRTTRSTNKLAGDETPIKKPKRQPTLFDSWPRTKEHKAPAATKRAAEGIAQAPAKRTRA